MMRPLLRLTLTGLLLIALVACGEADSSDMSVTATQADTSTPVSTTLSPSTTTPPPPSTTLAPDAVPPEIQGRWATVVPETGEEVDLLLFPTSFTIDRRYPDDPESRIRSSGRLSGEGETIEFSQGENCQGSGSYTWVLEGEVLTFAIEGADECGRAGILDGVTYDFVGPLP